MNPLFHKLCICFVVIFSLSLVAHSPASAQGGNADIYSYRPTAGFEWLSVELKSCKAKNTGKFSADITCLYSIASSEGTHTVKFDRRASTGRINGIAQTANFFAGASGAKSIKKITLKEGKRSSFRAVYSIPGRAGSNLYFQQLYLSFGTTGMGVINLILPFKNPK